MRTAIYFMTAMFGGAIGMMIGGPMSGTMYVMPWTSIAGGLFGASIGLFFGILLSIVLRKQTWMQHFVAGLVGNFARLGSV